jgi:hypothetical protein
LPASLATPFSTQSVPDFDAAFIVMTTVLLTLPMGYLILCVEADSANCRLGALRKDPCISFEFFAQRKREKRKPRRESPALKTDRAQCAMQGLMSLDKTSTAWAAYITFDLRAMTIL